MQNTKRLAIGAMFLSIMLVIGYIEYQIPTGVPGIKLGLSNSVLLLSLYWLGIPFSLGLMLSKVLLSGFLFGNPNAMIYSLAGGTLSMLGMIVAIYLLKEVSCIGAGVIGAVLHNVGQVTVAMWQLQTTKLIYYMAILMLVGVVTGLVTGNVCKQLIRYLPKSRRERFFKTE
ncbi:MAG: Gx transporter family protein [Christensenellales bacterium]|jgi:heptaprenyl diphosphate synthase|nr:Gx transporter family protein [Christensenellaceae bacterium]HHU02518.1 Gx transporter family protein [Christensenellaceae bacterium]